MSLTDKPPQDLFDALRFYTDEPLAPILNELERRWVQMEVDIDRIATELGKANRMLADELARMTEWTA